MYRGVITLTTDFGVDDTYAGVLKGVILKINPRAVIVDFCHGVEPQNIIQAGFLLNNSFHYFPFNSIHLAVVDPGVGTGRKAIILRVIHPPVTFIAPDNGLLSFVLAKYASGDAPPVPLREGGVLKGRVMHVDHFGNLITNVKKDDWTEEKVTIEIAGRKIEGLKTVYAGGETLIGLIDSSDYLEIALKNGSAARYLNAKIGDEVVMSLES